MKLLIVIAIMVCSSDTATIESNRYEGLFKAADAAFEKTNEYAEVKKFMEQQQKDIDEINQLINQLKDTNDKDKTIQ